MNTTSEDDSQACIAFAIAAILLGACCLLHVRGVDRATLHYWKGQAHESAIVSTK